MSRAIPSRLTVLGAALGAFALAQPAASEEDVLACWPLDGDGAEVIGGLDGDLLGAPPPTVIDGALEEALRFDGLFGEQVLVQSDPALEPEALTLSLWMRSPGPSDFRYLVAKGANDCESASYAIYLAGGVRFYVTTTSGAVVSSPTDATVLDDQWHQVAGTYSPEDGFVRLYVDGTEVGTGTPTTEAIDYSPVTMSASQDLHMGEWPTGCIPEYVGDLDEVRVYDRVLSPEEVAALYNGGVPQSCLAPTFDVDIKPGSDPSCVNINDEGVVPAAILGNPGFDVTRVVPESLALAGLPVRIKGNLLPQCGLEDVDEDGWIDLVCHFDDQSQSFALNPDGTASLTGMLRDGTQFDVPSDICLRPE